MQAPKYEIGLHAMTLAVEITLLTLSTCMVPLQGMPLQQETDLPGVSSDWFRCMGLPCEKRYDVIETTNSINNEHNRNQPYTGSSNDTRSELIENDVLLTPEQAVAILEMVRSEENRKSSDSETHFRRVKRKVVSSKSKVWNLPILYKFHSSLVYGARGKIRSAIAHIQAETCIPFFEISPLAAIPVPHLMIVAHTLGCVSYIGRVELERGSPQLISLPLYCLGELGIPVHELLHALGFWHEHQRPDRDDYVDIRTENLGPAYSSGFEKSPEDGVDSLGMPYDYSSVMHYDSTAGSTNGHETIELLDPLFQGNLGQRRGLSFLDAKLLNIAYCSDKCANHSPLSCKHGGYQDPKDCNTCRCPRGLTGRLCDTVQPSIGAACGGELFVGNREEIVITSPGYAQNMTYPISLECSWLIKTFPGSNLTLEFTGNFSIATPDRKSFCYNWVEVSHADTMATPGYRFCGMERPTGTITSSSHMLMVLRSEPSSAVSQLRVGFHAVVRGPDAIDIGEASTSQESTGTVVNMESGVTSQIFTEKYIERSILSEVSQTTSTPENTVHWSEWTGCAPSGMCGCGACTNRWRYRLCKGQRCTGDLAGSEYLPCDDPCGPGDMYYIVMNRIQRRPCPVCCGDYKIVNGKCVFQG